MSFDNKKLLIMDGAMGTELMRRGIELPLPLWSSMANIEEYDQVATIHKEYIESGCNVITTNTFRTTPRTFMKAGYSDDDAFKLSKKSFKMAVKAANKARVVALQFPVSIAHLGSNLFRLDLSFL